MATRKPRPSKVDPFADKVGFLPDKDIAELAKVTPENVRAYRKRRGIPARWRGEGEPLPKPTPSTKSKPKRRGGRKSKLDPFRDKLGVLPDLDVAELAGVTLGNVRAYRYRHGIPGPGRGKKAKAAESEPAAAPTRSPVAAPEPPKRSVTDQPAAPANPVDQAMEEHTEVNPAPDEVVATQECTGRKVKAFRVKVEAVDGVEAYVVIAENIASAAAKALQSLEQRHIEGEVLSLEYLAVALQQ